MKSRPIFMGALVVGVVLLALAGVLIFGQNDNDETPAENTAQTEDTSAAAMPDDEVHQQLTAQPAAGQSDVNPVQDFTTAGIAAAQAGDVEEAINAFQIAIAAAREDGEAALPHFYLGSLYLELGEIEDAITHLKAATEANAAMAMAWAQLGNAYLASGRPLSAIDAFDQALALAPDDPALLTNRGQAFMHIGDEAAFEKAKADFDRALEINPDLIAGYFNRGAYYMRVGNLEAAIDDFTSVLDIDPAQPAAHFNRAMAYRDLGEIDKAINDLVLVLAFRPDEALEAQAQAMLEELQAQQTEADGEPEDVPDEATEAPSGD